VLLQLLGASGHAKPEASALREVDLNVYLPTKGKRYHIKNWKNRLITLKWS